MSEESIFCMGRDREKKSFKSRNMSKQFSRWYQHECPLHRKLHFFCKNSAKTFLQHCFFNFQPTCTCVTGRLVLTGAKKLYFFHINCYYHVHCKGPKCCRHWLEDLKGWKWIKIQIKFFLVLCKICLQKKLQTKIISVK